MLEEASRKLIENPESLVHILDAFGFGHIILKHNEIRCGFSDGNNPTAISIKLDNEDIWVRDFSRNVTYTLIPYLVKEKQIPFRDVINVIKAELGVDTLYGCKKKSLFGGIYNNIGKRYDEIEIKTYPESILNKYEKVSNERFLKDFISIKVQKDFGIAYNIETQRIIIPIRDVYGNLCGVKARRNYDTDDPYDPKYIYEVPCPKSRLLYGAFENFDSLIGSDIIFIGESEKFCLQAASYGYENAVALMGNSLSEEQAKILIQFGAKKYCFMLDAGLDLEITRRNIQTLLSFSTMRQFTVSFFDWRNSLNISGKEAPTDNGKEAFEDIIKNELKEH